MVNTASPLARGSLVAGGWLLSAVSAVCIAVATLHPSVGNTGSPPGCVFCSPFAAVDAALNIVLFMPLGLGLAMARVRTGAAIIVIVGLSLLIEGLQVDIVPGRDAAIGDLLANSVGGLMALTCGRHATTLIHPSARVSERLFLGSLVAWVAVMGGVAFSLAPRPPADPYYAQFARQLRPSRPAFTGRIHSAAVDTFRLKPGRVTGGGALRNVIGSDAGALVRLTLLNAHAAPGRAEVFALSNADGLYVLSIHQADSDLVFSLRTGADAMRLRPYEFRLKGAFPAGAIDTTQVSARYGTQRVDLSALAQQSAVRRSIGVHLSDGWMLFSPRQFQVDGDHAQSIVGAVWISMLLFPTGYWLAFAWAAQRRRRAAYASCLLVGGAVAYAAVPALLGVCSGSLREWSAASAGLIGGLAITQPIRSRGRRAITTATQSIKSSGARK